MLNNISERDLDQSNYRFRTLSIDNFNINYSSSEANPPISIFDNFIQENKYNENITESLTYMDPILNNNKHSYEEYNISENDHTKDILDIGSINNREFIIDESVNLRDQLITNTSDSISINHTTSTINDDLNLNIMNEVSSVLTTSSDTCTTIKWNLVWKTIENIDKQIQRKNQKYQKFRTLLYNLGNKDIESLDITKDTVPNVSL
ncbi:hypothetical protein cand_002810 [Cryptosporidium andersoni]|uniref:Uncharacterized protein n=1 Tax=Cryptosporidium andersoni TaxID=117008 RepID=A0A1J4MP26_9CRYT|nr:hypothetical protein cand_002810 [Cryptosporidium andersoni]